MDGIRTPSMVWSGDLPHELMAFKQYVTLIFKGPLSKLKSEERMTYVLIWIGEEGLRIYNTWNNETKTLIEFWAHLSEVLEPRSNYRLARLLLEKMKQAKDELVDEYMTKCMLQAKKCKFRDETEIETRLIEQIIRGGAHDKVREDILCKDNTLTLDQAMKIARTYEALQSELKEFKAGSNTHIDHVSNRLSENKPKTAYRKTNNRLDKSHNDKITNYYVTCKYCGLKHTGTQCPAAQSECRFCHKIGHWAAVCRQKSKPLSAQYHNNTGHARKHDRGHDRTYDRGPDRTHDRSYDRTFDELKFNDLKLDEIAADPTRVLNTVLRFTLRGLPATMKAKVDTGAEGNILPLRTYLRMYPEHCNNARPTLGHLSPSRTTLTVYNGDKMVHYGTIDIDITLKKVTTQATFYVAETPGPIILGLPSITKMKVITINNVKTNKIKTSDDLENMYPYRFEGIGNFEGTYHIVTDPTVPPVIHSPRRPPISMVQEIKDELDQMEKTGVIKKVTEPTEWVSSLVYARKQSGKLRICLDPRDLNKAIMRPHYPTKNLEDVSYKLKGAKIFSKLDARQGYWAIHLDHESSLKTTFNSPHGRYRFLRLPFGLNLSQDVFQLKMDMIIENCPGTLGIADDIAVFGKNEEEHDANLHHLMTRAREGGLIFNKEKCTIKQTSIHFFGLIFNETGAKPDPARLDAIRDMKSPTNKTQLQEFLGIATYMSPFVPNLSTHAAPLRDLLKKETDFTWTSSHEKKFDDIKTLICRDSELTYFDPAKEIVIQVDVSGRGLGAVLTQSGKPIAYASKSLTECEQRYANIEREMLAVVFGCTRFHTYIYGKRCTIQSDHKPLSMIILKNIASAPTRLQRMLLRLQSYDIDIEYIPGKCLPLPDTLSRQPLPENNEILFDKQISYTRFSEPRIMQIKNETKKEKELQELSSMIIKGWPKERRDIPQTIREYWPFRDELTIENGMIIKGNQILIPTHLRPEILKDLHIPHLGIVKTNLLAKTCIYWPRMNKDIQDLTGECSECQTHQRRQTPVAFVDRRLPREPWEAIAADLFELNKENYLLVADIYTKFPILRKLRNTHSSSIIQTLKEIFSEHGIPRHFHSDNGPQFSATSFAQFAASWGFQHNTSSPHYPQSNGFIERQIQTIKRILTKTDDPEKALLFWRATPLERNHPSPAELLYGRIIKTTLPKTKVPASTKQDKLLNDRQKKASDRYNTKARTNKPTLNSGQRVFIRNPINSTWSPGTIHAEHPSPNSYMVDSDLTGSRFRRTLIDIVFLSIDRQY